MVGSLSAAGLACAARYDRLCEGGPRFAALPRDDAHIADFLQCYA